MYEPTWVMLLRALAPVAGIAVIFFALLTIGAGG